jgi:hypothetical protein
MNALSCWLLKTNRIESLDLFAFWSGAKGQPRNEAPDQVKGSAATYHLS